MNRAAPSSGSDSGQLKRRPLVWNLEPDAIAGLAAFLRKGNRKNLAPPELDFETFALGSLV